VDVEALEREALAAIAEARSADELEEVRVRTLGRKSPLKLALREVRDRESGMALNAVRERVEQALAARQVDLERPTEDPTFDPTLPGDEAPRGSYHLITQVRRQIEDVFIGMGYEIYDGLEVDTVENNFDALNTPEAHPSRDPRDTFYLDDHTLLRTHTSPSQVRAMRAMEPPVYLASLGRVYRRDTIDATHYPIFHQFEGLAVDRGITLADLKGTLQYVMRALYGEDRAIRFRTHYFPFTEPSIEPDVSCPICDMEGCRTCKFTGWVEMGGAGMVDPQVFVNVGLDPEEWTGFAFGCGIERAAQLRYAIPVIKPLWENDLRVLRQFR
jgi:phenylalanyl-tRNA synthetase alpha chain